MYVVKLYSQALLFRDFFFLNYISQRQIFLQLEPITHCCNRIIPPTYAYDIYYLGIYIFFPQNDFLIFLPPRAYNNIIT